LFRPRGRMPSERRWAMDGPSACAVGQEDEPKVPDVSRANKWGRRLLVTLGLSKVTRPGPKGGRNPVEGGALASCVAKPRHHIQSANVRIRCAIRTYDSITPGDYGFPHPDPLPRGRGDKDAGSGNKQEIEREPIRLPFLRHGQWHVANAIPYRLVAAFIPSTNSFRRVSICSGFWWWVSIIFTTAEPEMAPAAPAAMASRT